MIFFPFLPFFWCVCGLFGCSERWRKGKKVVHYLAPLYKSHVLWFVFLLLALLIYFLFAHERERESCQLFIFNSVCFLPILLISQGKGMRVARFMLLSFSRTRQAWVGVEFYFLCAHRNGIHRSTPSQVQNKDGESVI